MNPGRSSNEISILAEKLKALLILVSCERDLEKLKVYKRELDLVRAELQKRQATFRPPQSSNGVPFKKPVRSA